MILADWEIRDRIASGSIKVDPFDDSLINPASLDYRLGGKFGIVKCKEEIGYRKKKHPGLSIYYEDRLRPIKKLLPVNPLDKDSFEMKYIEAHTYELSPGAFVIAHTLESITIPDDLAMICKGKSSLGRLGLANSDMAGFVDPGWSGILTLELFNHSKNTILLTKGMKIGQFVFYDCEKVEKPYGETGRYQGQSPGEGSKGI